MPGWLNAVIGGLEIGAGIAGEVLGAALIGTGVGAPLGAFIMAAPALLGMGIGTEINAIGTMLSKGPLAGGSTSERNPIAARECVYGRVATGGTMIYCSQFGNNNKYVDMIFDLADFNPSLYVTGLMVDRQLVQIDTTAKPVYTGSGDTYPQISSGMSFTPLQQNSAIGGSGSPSPKIHSIQRTGDVVTVVTKDNGSSGGDIPLLIAGSYVVISGVPEDSNPAHDIYQTLNGRYQVTSVSAHTGSSVTFTYTCGGVAALVMDAGYVSTQWPLYGSRIYMEVLTGTQTLGQTFVGMTLGTPDPAAIHGGAAITYANQGYGGGIGGPWTADCSCVGSTIVMVRLNYDSKEMPYIPQISFLLSGKATILNPDPLASHGGLAPLATGYTENWALCVADYMCDPIAGYGMTIGVDISLADLITAAVISDQAVSLAAGGTEPRYACNGKFSLAMSRGEILKNLLTAGAGRIRESANGWVIQAGAWPGSGTAAPGMAHLMPYEWSPTVTMTELFNGIKGTYIWPGNNWQSSDFPPYAQDTTHDPSDILGYGAGPGYSDKNVIADGGQRRWLDIQLPFTISPSAAQRIAKIELLRRRQFGTGVLRYDLFAYQFTSLDIITETIPYLGTDWTAKTLEVSKFRFTPSPKGFITELQVQEADASVYDWSTIEELTPAGYTQPVIPSTQNPSVPTSLTLESDVTTEFVETSGKTHSRILVSWTPPTDGYVLSGGHIEEQFQLVGALIWTSLPSVDPTSTFTYISDVVDGDQYNVQIRSVNAAGVPSAWIFAGPVTVGSSYGAGVSVYGPNGGISFPPYGDPLYPQAVSNLSVAGQVQSDGSVLVSVNVGPVVPVNVFSTLIPAPIIDGTFTVSGSGGAIPGPQTVFVSLVGVDSAGTFTALSNQITCAIPSGSTGSIALTIDNYTSAMVGFLVYVGLNSEILYYRYTVSAAGTLTLTSIATVTGNSYGMPDGNFNSFVIGTTRIALAAVPLPATTLSVAGVMVVTAYTFLGGPLEKATIAGAAFTPSALIGRTLSLVQLVSGQTFPLDFVITANDATSITFDIPSPPGGWMGTPATLTAGDLVCVRMQPTMSGGGTVVADGLLALTVHQFKGFVLRVLFADGHNESSFIVDNTSNSFTVQADNPFLGSNPVWFWVEAGSFSALVPTTPAQVGSYSSLGVPLSVAIDNIPGFYGIQEFASNNAGALSDAGFSPIRDILWLGQAGTGGGVSVTVTTTATIAPDVSQVLVDATAGAFTITLPTPSAMLYPIALVRKDSTANVVTLQHATGTIQGAATLALDNAVLKSVTLVPLTATTSKIQSFYGTTSGSSAVFTIYDPRYYGGDPSGMTDASAAISSAIAAGGLFLDFGTVYLYTWAAIATAFGAVVTGFQIYGGGTLRLASGSTPALTFAGTAVIKLLGVTIDGNGQTGTDPVLYLNAATNVYLTGLTVIGGGSNPNFAITGTCTYEITSCHGLVTQTGLI